MFSKKMTKIDEYHNMIFLEKEDFHSKISCRQKFWKFQLNFEKK